MHDISWEQGQEMPLGRRDELDAIAESIAEDVGDSLYEGIRDLPENESDYVKSKVLELL